MQQGAANGQEAAEYYAQTGEKALWTNSLFGGMPTFQISPEYESNRLFMWINDVYGLGLPSPANLLFMMMFGFLILLFVMKMRWYFALLGAIAWGFSSYFIIIIGAGHIWKFLALSYVPPTIAGVILCYRGRYICGAAMTALAAMMQLNANHPQMTYYFGLVIGAMMIAYLCQAIRRHSLKKWGVATCAVIISGCLALGANAPSLYNTYEYQKETKRSQSELTPLNRGGEEGEQTGPKPTGGMPYEQIIGWSYGGSESFSLFIPNIKGGSTAKPQAGKMVTTPLSTLDEAKDYANEPSAQMLNYLSQYFNDSEGTNGPVYVGVIIFALFVVGCIIVRGPLKWALLVMTILSVLLALGSNFPSLTDFMIYNFPLYNKFRAVESILVIAEFCIPLLAVMALWQLYKTPDAWQRYKLPVLLTFGGVALICVIALAMPSVFGSAITSNDEYIASQFQQQVASYMASQPGMTQEAIDKAVYAYSMQNPQVSEMVETLRYGMVRSDALRSLLFLVFGGAIVLVMMRGRKEGGKPANAALCVGAMTLLVLIDLYGVDKRYVSEESFCDAKTSNEPYFAPDAIDNAILADTDMSYRVLDIPGFESHTRSYFHKMLGGYHAAKLIRYEDLIQRRLRPMMAMGYNPAIRNIPDSVLAEYSADEQEMIKELQADYRVLDMLNTRYIITGNQEAPLMVNTHALGNGWLVDSVIFVDGADAEMAALSDINPAIEAVADSKYRETIGVETSAKTPGDTLIMTGYTPNKLTYKSVATKPVVGVFSEVYFPWGWKATVDGQPVALARVNYLLRAMDIPAGEHTIEMVFDPESLHTTTTLAYICVTLIYMLLLMALFVEVKRTLLS